LDATEDIPNGIINIEFDIANNTVTVMDNGKGFPANREFFGLGKGTKSGLGDINVRGEHGIGIKMIVLCTKEFELFTRKPDGKIWYAKFNDGFKFLEGIEKEYFDEDYQKVSDLPEGYTTKVTYKFPSSSEQPLRNISLRSFIKTIIGEYQSVIPFEEYLRKKSFTQLIFEHYFRTHSYSGDANRLFDNKKPCEIVLKIRKDEEFSDAFLKDHYPPYVIEFWESQLPIQFPAKYWDVTEIFPQPSKKGFLTEDFLKSFNPGTTLGDSRIWSMKITDKDQLKNLLVNPLMRDFYSPEEFNDFIERKVIGVYLVIASASKKGRYNINKMILGRPDQIIAADGVLTTNQIRTPKRGKNQNYLNNIHFLINIRDRVNYGKQGIKNPKLLTALYKYFEEIYVKKLVDLAVSVAGKQPKPPAAFEEPEISFMELKNIVSPPNLSIKKEPVKENTLIALFYELIGKGIIPGIMTYQLSSFDPYDGKINMIKPKSADFKEIRRDADLLNIEFKINMKELIDDFETGVKNLEDINLIVVWIDDLPGESTKYHYLDIEQSSYEGLSINGINDVLADMSGNQAPILVLSKLVNLE
jgi:hypothetical protein